MILNASFNSQGYWITVTIAAQHRAHLRAILYLKHQSQAWFWCHWWYRWICDIFRLLYIEVEWVLDVAIQSIETVAKYITIFYATGKIPSPIYDSWSLQGVNKSDLIWVHSTLYSAIHNYKACLLWLCSSCCTLRFFKIASLDLTITGMEKHWNWAWVHMIGKIIKLRPLHTTSEATMVFLSVYCCPYTKLVENSFFKVLVVVC